jgi:Amt family ammonium transporter
VAVAWVLWGYSLAFGPDIGGFIGNLSWGFLNNVTTEPGPYSDDIPHQAFMVFQGMFAIITPALVTGAFAERIKFGAYVAFVLLWMTIVYAPLAHWVWGGGWLSDISNGAGVRDFAGGTVVHIASGYAALAAALIFGRRVGLEGAATAPHNVPFIVLGAAFLWFGWFGFNAGSSLGATAQATNAFVVTNLSAATATLAWVTMSWIIGKRPSVVGAATGAIAGLAAITPAAGYVGPMPAIIIGAVSGCLCYGAVSLLNRVRVDDSLDVWGVHGIGSTWGMLAAGLLFGIGFGALEAGVGRGEQILYQLIGIGATMGWAFVMTSIILLAIKYTIGLRVSDPEEQAGLDISQHAEEAYTTD